MTDCCTDTGKPAPRKHPCPVNGRDYRAVHLKTVLQHVRQPWAAPAKQQGYYFCSDPDCDVVYYAEDGATFLRSEVRTDVGIKTAGKDQLLCYCFGITKHEAEQNRSLKQFVVTKTSEAMCACETRNPSGRCCLADFPKQ